ncbi:MAG: UDP-N-acetylmuramoyl-tripeptide--D-alanyl-D-alanine ligase [Candidatus Gastranaerophilaceae bacterium]
MKFTLDEIIEATGAKILKNDGVSDLKFAISTDTRTIKKGEIYLPIKGENFDGEKFIDKALGAGAIGYFCTKHCPPLETLPSKTIKYCFERGQPKSIDFGGGNSMPILVLQVENTLTAYLQLANFYRKKIDPTTVAITGSSGKTTTKEMAYCVASEKFKTHKSELNFNNEIGLCKTILSMPENTQVLIVEMGMRGSGEIELLSKYAEPDIAIIANVGTAHIGRLGSRENIAKAKCEIIKHLKKNGTLIAHDDELIKKTIENYPSPQPSPARGEGVAAIIDSPPLTSHVSPLTSHAIYFSLNDTKILERKIGYSKFIYKNHEYELNIEGDYNIENSLAAIELGLKLGINENEIASGLKKYSPIEKRWEVQEIKEFKIINDSYNANPESMKAAITTALDIYPPPLLFVLGDMGELGENEIEYHREIGEFLIEKIKANVNVITVGKLANEISEKLIENGIFSKNFKTNFETSRYILDNVKIGTTIILKASRAMKFEEILNEVKR